MDYLIRFANYHYLYWLLPVFLVSLIIRYYWQRHVYYQHALGNTLASAGFAATASHTYILSALRIITVSVLLLLIAKPQVVDMRSKITVEGVDIMLVLDVSGSMQFRDYDDDQRSRIEVAKDEAIHFIQKRTNDAIGLVIFGQDAVSRAPVTLDKPMLIELVKGLELGVINPDGTMLATAIVTAANRLKQLKGASKIMILLTDGEPSEGDMDPQLAIDVAKKLGIKIYTIGIGSDQERFLQHPLLGIVRAAKINTALLTHIAQATGGQFFLARNSRDMRAIYDTIDRLEKTKIESPLFTKYYDIFLPFVILSIILLLVELVLTSWWWFGI